MKRSFLPGDTVKYNLHSAASGYGIVIRGSCMLDVNMQLYTVRIVVPETGKLLFTGDTYPFTHEELTLVE